MRTLLGAANWLSVGSWKDNTNTRRVNISISILWIQWKVKNRTCIIKSNIYWSIYLLSVLVMLPLYHFSTDSEKMFVCYIRSWGHRLLKFLFCGSEIRNFWNHCIGGYETLNLSKILMFILLLISKQYRVNRFPKLSTTSWSSYYKYVSVTYIYF